MLVPVLTMAGALLLDLLPMPILPAPWVLLAVLYHWSVIQPERLPPMVTFAFGIAADALGGFPLGVTGTSLLVVQALLRPRQCWLRQQGWPVIWLAFLAVAAMAAALRWALSSVLDGRMLPVAPIATEAGLSVLVYPLVTGAMALLPR
jgi:rod shape-determining protein MreD